MSNACAHAQKDKAETRHAACTQKWFIDFKDWPTRRFPKPMPPWPQ
jgi:hypothetical protein